MGGARNCARSAPSLWTNERGQDARPPLHPPQPATTVIWLGTWAGVLRGSQGDGRRGAVAPGRPRPARRPGRAALELFPALSRPAPRTGRRSGGPGAFPALGNATGRPAATGCDRAQRNIAQSVQGLRPVQRVPSKKETRSVSVSDLCRRVLIQFGLLLTKETPRMSERVSSVYVEDRRPNRCRRGVGPSDLVSTICSGEK